MTGPTLDSAEWVQTALGKLKAWKPPPGRWWVERYNYAIRKGYSEKFATIYADQGRS